MKKLAALFLLFVLLMSAAALAEGLSVGMPNPVVETDDAADFERTLGIRVDAASFPSDELRMSIIDNTIGQIAFDLENVNGEWLQWVFRFTFDDALDGSLEAFAGIYAVNVTEPETVDIPVEDMNVPLTALEADDFTVYFWTFDGVHCCLTIDGMHSGNQFAAVMDVLFTSCRTANPAQGRGILTDSPDGFIGKERAGEIAIEQAGGGRVVSIEQDVEHGVDVYEVEVHTDKYEFEFEIDAKSGKVLESERELLDDDD